MHSLADFASMSAFHSGMLEVRRRSETPGLTAAGVGLVGAAGGGGGDALAFLDRAGLVRRVTNIARAAPDLHTEPLATMVSASGTLGPAAASFAYGAAAAPPNAVSPLSRTVLIELAPEADLAGLHMALARDPEVETVSRVPVRYVAARGRRAVPAPPVGAAALPPAASTMWNLRQIRWSEARQAAGFRDANTIKVAVLDTGIDMTHPELAGRITSYVFAHPDLSGSSGARDLHGHGTHVAGTIAAAINGDIGINGICTPDLRIWKIFSDEPIMSGSRFSYVVDPAMYLRALADCLEDEVDVINLSIGGEGQPSAQEADLFRSLIARGTTVVAAMGNGRQQGSRTSFPAAIPNVIAVGATTIDDTVADFSNRGNHITVSAPGRAIWSTLPTQPGQTEFEVIVGLDGKPRQGKAMKREENFDAWNGTSMAAPHVSAAVALLLARRGPMSSAEVREALKVSSDKVARMAGEPWHPDYGFGRLNLERLL